MITGNFYKGVLLTWESKLAHGSVFFDNGQLWDEGSYVDGKKVGEWKVYDRDGALKLHKVFKPRKLAGE